MTDPIAIVQASPLRRLIALGLLAVLGGLLIVVAATKPLEIWARLATILVGGGVVFVAENVRRATLGWLELHADGIYDQDGTLLVSIDEVETLVRGHLTNKPSNGFVIVTTRPGARAWAPGLWWRVGRRFGVGGIPAAAQSKIMADALQSMLSERLG